MRIHRHRLALAVLAALALPAATAAAQGLELTADGAGTLGALTTFQLTGNPGDQYLLVLSLSGGPTVLPPPNQPASIDVGFDLITLAVQLPGFLGNLDGAGQAQIPLFFPPLAVLADVQLHFQALRIVNGVRFDGASNPWILRPTLPQDTRATIGTMPVLRAGFTATSRSDGKVVFVGGGPDGLVASYGQASIDVYDPSVQQWSVIGQLSQPRVSHTTTLLDDGRLLVVGGAEDVLGEPTRTAELVDPFTGQTTALPNLSIERALHTATKLPDGRVLIAGGTSSFQSPQDIVEGASRTTEIFDPLTDTFSAGPDMSSPRVGHRADALQDGRVLVTGGYSWFTLLGFKVPFVSDTAQLYTPAAGAGSFGSNLTMGGDRFGHNSIVLDDGDVLLIGGAQDVIQSPFDPIATSTTEIFDVTTQTFSPGATMSVARGAAAVAKLPSGEIVVAGGGFGSLSVPTPTDAVDILDGSGTTLNAAFQMIHARTNFQAVTLPDGTVLLAGGGEEDDPQNPGNPLSFDDAEILHR